MERRAIIIFKLSIPNMEIPSWNFRLVSTLKRNLWNEKNFCKSVALKLVGLCSLLGVIKRT